MLEQQEVNLLVYNILNTKRYSNCRLCLKSINNHYVRLDDMVCLDTTYPSSEGYVMLSEAILILLGDTEKNFSDVIPGIEACCISCVESVLQAVRFLKTLQQSSSILNQVFSNLSETLSRDIEVNNANQALYITIEDSSTNLIVMDNELKKKRIPEDEEYAFECLKCNDYFEDFLSLNAHNLTHHNTYTCENCFDIFPTESELIVHGKANHRYECTDCSQSWDSEEGLRRHEDRVHNMHVCKECGKSYKGLDRLQVHESKHGNKSECPKCGKQYTTREFFTKHVNLCLVDKLDPHPVRSSYVRSYACKQCDKSYSTPGGLRVHIRFAHENATPHICKECGKKFTAPSYLKVHMIKHTGEKNFECEICKGRFVSKEALLYHTRRHTGEKPYSCKICNEKFVNASSRAEHIKFRHVGPTLMCEICSRKFVTSLFLKQHISRHHDPSSKLYYGRNMIPPNMPGEENMRFKVATEKWRHVT